MSKKADKRFSVKTDVSLFKRLGKGNQENIARNHQVQTAVCKYWLEGRCTRNPCKFLHSQPAKTSSKQSKYTWKNPVSFKSENSPPIENAQRTILKNKLDCCQNQSKSTLKTQQKLTEVNVGQSKSIPKIQQKKHKLCNYWVTESCKKGDKCENLHSWFSGNGLSMVSRLEGHTKAVTGIALPSGSNKLYCGSKDKSLRVWDCNSGQCGAVLDFDDECATLVNEGPWIFVGLRDMIKAWNLNTQHELVIRGNGGQVNAITMFEDILFAGMEDGTVLSWKSTSETSFSGEPTSLVGHTKSVLSLIVGAKRLFSGSADQTIRVWDAESLECVHVLNGHTDDVTTVLCWDHYLLSGSLDKKIKVWAATGSGNIEEVYEHDVDDGVLAFCGMHDAEAKPILLCSCKDNGVCLYDLPSFVGRGRVLSTVDIQTTQIGHGGLFFTGDAAGLVSVWKLHGEPECKSS
ncbi:zinc finger CCCH domain-containing protein 48-like isoform X2 [Cynara cardunculus var. scolymus]|nr:zinc finger CCCH domain-containing protein 48-like isoform X2 [Cynara cardunculus var. scolymus]